MEGGVTGNSKNGEATTKATATATDIDIEDLLGMRVDSDVLSEVVENPKDFSKAHFRCKTKKQIDDRLKKLVEMAKRDKTGKGISKRTKERTILRGKRFLFYSEALRDEMKKNLLVKTVYDIAKTLIEMDEFQCQSNELKKEQREEYRADVTARYYQIGSCLEKRCEDRKKSGGEGVEQS